MLVILIHPLEFWRQQTLEFHIRSRAIFIGNRHNLKNPYPMRTHSKENYESIESAIDDLVCMQRDPKINHEWTKHSEFEERIMKVKPRIITRIIEMPIKDNI